MAYYKLDDVINVPITDVLENMYGIRLQQKGQKYLCNIREEKTPSCYIYPGNTFYDFGAGFGGNVITLVSFLDNSSWKDALDKIGAAYHLEDVSQNRTNDKNFILSNAQFSQIGINPELATLNFDIDVDKYGVDKTSEFSEKYHMDVTELAEQYPIVYHNMLRARAVPFIAEQKNLYYMAIYNQIETCKQLGVDILDNKNGIAELEETITHLEQIEGYLAQAIQQKALLSFTPTQYNLKKDIRNIMSGKTQIEIGNTPYVDVKTDTKAVNEKVVYKKVALAEYNKMLDNIKDKVQVPHAAFLNAGDNTVNIAYNSAYSSFIENAFSQDTVDINNTNDKDISFGESIIIDDITLTNFAFDDDGYLHFSAAVNNYEYDGLFRVRDRANGNDLTLVSIDYGYNEEKFAKNWDVLENQLSDYSQNKYIELKGKEQSVDNPIMEDINNMDISAKNELLGRLKADCDYFLAAGGRENKFLWAKDVTTQIETMRDLYSSLAEKPTWLTLEDINAYEKQMQPVVAQQEEVINISQENISQEVFNKYTEKPGILKFENCSFNNVTISDKDIKATIAEIRNSQLESCKLLDFNCPNIDCSGTEFSRCEFDNAVLTGAKMQDTDFTNSRLSDTNFEGKAIFNRSSFIGMQIKNCDFNFAEFPFASFRDTSFKNCGLSGADFFNATMNNVDFKNARINARSVNGIDTINWQLNGATSDELNRYINQQLSELNSSPNHQYNQKEIDLVAAYEAVENITTENTTEYFGDYSLYILNEREFNQELFNERLGAALNRLNKTREEFNQENHEPSELRKMLSQNEDEINKNSDVINSAKMAVSMDIANYDSITENTSKLLDDNNLQLTTTNDVISKDVSNDELKAATQAKENGVSVMLSGMTKDEKMQKMRELITEGTKEVFSSEKYKQFLSVMSQFYNYSFRNSMLIMMQKPTASYVAGFRAWQKKFNRTVRKGEKGIKILGYAPKTITVEVEKQDANGQTVKEKEKKVIDSFAPVTVFDISQTEGEPLPTLTDEISGNVEKYDIIFDAVKQNTDYSISFEPASVLGEVKGYCSYNEKRIVIKDGMSESQQVKTLIHEFTHSELHSPENDEADEVGRNVKELQAESVAYMVCAHLGIDTSDYSFPYLASWSESQKVEDLQNSLTIIQKEANSIITKLETSFAELQKEANKDVDVSLDAQATKIAKLYDELVQGDDIARKIEPFSIENEKERIEAITNIVKNFNVFNLNYSADTTRDRLEKRYAPGSKEFQDVVKLHSKVISSFEEYQQNVLENLVDKNNGEPLVAIKYSEDAKFNQGDVMPLSEASAKFQAADQRQIDAVSCGETMGYNKVDFIIHFKQDGVINQYDGRQDMGDGDGTILDHIKATNKYNNDPNMMQQFSKAAQKRVLNIKNVFIPYLSLHTDLSNIEKSNSELSGAVSDLRHIINNGFPVLAENVPKEINADIFKEYNNNAEKKMSALAHSYGITVDDLKSADWKTPLDGERTYSIYQLNDDAGYRFMRYNSLEKTGTTPQLNDYKEVYSGTLAADETLNSIFYRFNMERPDDFTGHSLSVSDVIVINHNGNITANYVDAFDFKELPAFAGLVAAHLNELHESMTFDNDPDLDKQKNRQQLGYRDNDKATEQPRLSMKDKLAAAEVKAKEYNSNRIEDSQLKNDEKNKEQRGD